MPCLLVLSILHKNRSLLLRNASVPDDSLWPRVALLLLTFPKECQLDSLSMLSLYMGLAEFSLFVNHFDG